MSIEDKDERPEGCSVNPLGLDFFVDLFGLRPA
jgi:hypothetical protein